LDLMSKSMLSAAWSSVLSMSAPETMSRAALSKIEEMTL